MGTFQKMLEEVTYRGLFAPLMYLSEIIPCPDLQFIRPNLGPKLGLGSSHISDFDNEAFSKCKT